MKRDTKPHNVTQSWKWTITSGAFLVLVTSFFWLFSDPNFEPLIAVLSSFFVILTYFGLRNSRFQDYLDRIIAVVMLIVGLVVLIIFLTKNQTNVVDSNNLQSERSESKSNDGVLQSEQGNELLSSMATQVAIQASSSEDSVIAVSVRACMEVHNLSKQHEITIITDVPYEGQGESPGSLFRRRKIAYCQWPPSWYSDSNGYVEIIVDEVKGPGFSQASGASNADRIYSRCDKLEIDYFWGKQFVSSHSSFEVSANSIVTARGEQWDPEIMSKHPEDYYYNGLPVLGFYTEDREVVVIHEAAYELEDVRCIQ